MALFLLGYHSHSDKLFRGLPHDGVRREHLAVLWIVKRKEGQLVMVGKEERDAVEAEEETGSKVRLGLWVKSSWSIGHASR
jgi:hypothetical protein